MREIITGVAAVDVQTLSIHQFTGGNTNNYDLMSLHYNFTVTLVIMCITKIYLLYFTNLLKFYFNKF